MKLSYFAKMLVFYAVLLFLFTMGSIFTSMDSPYSSIIPGGHMLQQQLCLFAILMISPTCSVSLGTVTISGR